MQAKRHKNIRKVFEIYSRTFDFPKEVKVLVDPNFVKISQDLGFNVLDKLEKIIGSKITLWTTPCLIKELKKIGTPLQQCFLTCQALRTSDCTHLLGKELGNFY